MRDDCRKSFTHARAFIITHNWQYEGKWNVFEKNTLETKTADDWNESDTGRITDNRTIAVRNHKETNGKEEQTDTTEKRKREREPSCDTLNLIKMKLSRKR